MHKSDVKPPLVFRDPREAALAPGSVVAIGSFDGVHLGHKAVLANARALVEELRQGGELVALSFDPHPAKVLAPELAPALIGTIAHRAQWLGEAGADKVVWLPFDRALAAQMAPAFIHELLVGQLGAAAVVVGYDFTFGRGGEGNTRLLEAEGAKAGLAVRITSPFYLDGLLVSSTKIREFVLSGRMAGAARLLGRPFELTGEVVRGAGRGRQLGFPTANVAAEQELLPAFGVYAGMARVGGQRVQAAVSVGIVPTFDNNAVTVEAYLLDFDQDLYGQTIAVEFVKRLRPELRFDGPEALVVQIKKDVEQVREILDAR